MKVKELVKLAKVKSWEEFGDKMNKNHRVSAIQ